jgi:protein-S-isoprenylcysteine O-methyltransferase Ste14
MKTRYYHLLLVTIQFGGMFYFLISGKIFPETLIATVLMLSAMLLVAWAILSMNSKTLTAMPGLRKEASLVVKGPYRFVRHPMYTAVILMLSGLLVNDFSLIRLLVLMAVLAVLLIKTEIEEYQLNERFPEYAEYQKRTKKLIPFLF